MLDKPSQRIRAERSCILEVNHDGRNGVSVFIDNIPCIFLFEVLYSVYIKGKNDITAHVFAFGRPHRTCNGRNNIVFIVLHAEEVVFIAEIGRRIECTSQVVCLTRNQVVDDLEVPVRRNGRSAFAARTLGKNISGIVKEPCHRFIARRMIADGIEDVAARFLRNKLIANTARNEDLVEYEVVCVIDAVRAEFHRNRVPIAKSADRIDHRFVVAVLFDIAAYLKPFRLVIVGIVIPAGCDHADKQIFQLLRHRRKLDIRESAQPCIVRDQIIIIIPETIDLVKALKHTLVDGTILSDHTIIDIERRAVNLRSPLRILIDLRKQIGISVRRRAVRLGANVVIVVVCKIDVDIVGIDRILRIAVVKSGCSLTDDFHVSALCFQLVERRDTHISQPDGILPHITARILDIGKRELMGITVAEIGVTGRPIIASGILIGNFTVNKDIENIPSLFCIRLVVKCKDCILFQSDVQIQNTVGIDLGRSIARNIGVMNALSVLGNDPRPVIFQLLMTICEPGCRFSVQRSRDLFD